jgi:aryl carrier-like protein
MIPSIFIALDKLPLNTNGKIDRKLLPSPDFSHLSTTHLTNRDNLLIPTNEIQLTIHQIWCDIFQQNKISIDTNIYAIGGHSLLLMQLLLRYRTQFHLETNTLFITDLLQHPTIIDHAQLIHRTIDNVRDLDDHYWHPLHLIQGTK